ncbi:CPBP family intramembrane glutamic endopeptidase [Paenibacillus brevis]|uniref:CPBP family intramembrane metalloprotease n=1 Tax=Paenibacillus brevis TaxID=2841508 RepID=A0ABS6FYP0_9BACL|nr:type II CAAX endopeptidase family protein [Paenibacillus brevis]MBU5674597.1 CPBP family intramembrane metalloprotease [Paenibacillus brevis]
MNSEVRKVQPRRLGLKTLWIMAAVGLVLFVVLQILPASPEETKQVEQAAKIITKQEAAEAAAEFAVSALGLQVQSGEGLVVYDTDSDLYGYLTRDSLLEPYLNDYEAQFPYDKFQVRFDLVAEAYETLAVDVHMTSGQVVGYELLSSLFSMTPAEEDVADWEGAKAQVTPILEAVGYSADQQWVVEELPSRFLLSDPQQQIGEAYPKIEVSLDQQTVTGIHKGFALPDSFTNYVKQQQTFANWMTYLGYALLTFVLGILAIVYSALTKAHTSFKRGIVLASVYFVLSMGSALNMLPYFEKEGMTGGLLVFALVFQGGVTLVLAASVYFSLVGGDGLWRQQGTILWSRSRETGYGRHVLRSVSEGYAWALIIMGVQSVLFFLLEKTIHTWSTTDASQSAYNMLYPALLPALAWVAGIGEEAVYRLFGIPMLKKMFKSTIAASIITTLIWAFGHTLYPIYPVISRPIELLFIGLIFSYIFLRHGFITAVFAHVIFDSLLMSISIMFMGGTLNIVSGLFFIVLPLLVAYLIYLFNPSNKERPPVLNKKEEEPLFTTPHLGGHL